MKKGVLIIVALVGMMASCAQKTCPTYLHNPQQSDDLRVQVEKPLNSDIQKN